MSYDKIIVRTLGVGGLQYHSLLNRMTLFKYHISSGESFIPIISYTENT